MNERVNKKSYRIDGLRELLSGSVLPEQGGLARVANLTGIPQRTLRRVCGSGSVSRSIWNTLLNRLPQYRLQIEALCPEGWGGEKTEALQTYDDPSSRSQQVLSSFNPGNKLAGTDYTIISRISGPTRTASFIARNSAGKKFFIKTIRDFPKSATKKVIKEIHELTTKFIDQTASHSKLTQLKGIARVVRDDKLISRNFPYPIPYLVQDYVDGIKFNEFLAEKNGKISASEWFRVARQLLETLRLVHAAGVIHGDICPDNILFTDGNPVIVDFGESFIVETHFFKESDKTYSRQVEYVAPERRVEGGKWRRPADLYGLGGVLFRLACGEDPPTPIISNYELKDRIFERIAELNPLLLEENTGIADVTLQCLHYSVEDRVSSAARLLDLLAFYEEVTTQPSENTTNDFKRATEDILNQVKDLQASERKIFAPFILDDIRSISRRLNDVLAGNFVQVAGDREDVIMGLLRYLSLLGDSDLFYTLTVPDFWSEDNLGIDGRFLRFNATLARRGVTIRRVFLVTDADKSRPIVNRVMAAHIKMLGSLPNTINTEDKKVSSKGYYTGFVDIDPRDRDAFVGHGHSVGLARIKNEWLVLHFKANDRNQMIRRVEFRKEDDLPSGNLEEFFRHLDNSTFIGNFPISEKAIRK